MSTKAGLTAWERWELASFDTPAEDAASTPADATPSPENAVAPEPTFEPNAQEVELAALRATAHEQGLAEGQTEGFEAGHAEGYAAGHEAGEATGRTLAETLGREQAEKLASLSADLERQLQDLDNAVAKDLLALALAVAHKIVGHTLAAKPDVVIELIHEALAQLPAQHAAIQLHPEDASLARLYAGEMLSHAGHRIQENPKLQRGDVVVEVGGSHVDARIATRWQRVLDTLGQTQPWDERGERRNGDTASALPAGKDATPP